MNEPELKVCRPPTRADLGVGRLASSPRTTSSLHPFCPTSLTQHALATRYYPTLSRAALSSRRRPEDGIDQQPQDADCRPRSVRGADRGRDVVSQLQLRPSLPRLCVLSLLDCAHQFCDVGLALLVCARVCRLNSRRRRAQRRALGLRVTGDDWTAWREVDPGRQRPRTRRGWEQEAEETKTARPVWKEVELGPGQVAWSRGIETGEDELEVCLSPPQRSHAACILQ